MGVISYLRKVENELNQVGSRLRAGKGDVVKKLDKLIEEKKAKDREISDIKQKFARREGADIIEGIKEINGVKVLIQIVEDIHNPKELREHADRIKDKLKSGVALLGARADGKAFLLALVTKDLTDRFHAGNIVKRVAESIGGSGGGRPDMAQAGAPDVESLDEAFNSAVKFIFP